MNPRSVCLFLFLLLEQHLFIHAIDPTVLVDGEAKDVISSFERAPSSSSSSSSSSSAVCGEGYECYILNAEKPVMYAVNFLNTSIIEELISFCLNPKLKRFRSSPIRTSSSGSSSSTSSKSPKDGDDGDVILQEDTIRTSESCVFIPASTYLKNERFLSIREQHQKQQQQQQAAGGGGGGGGEGAPNNNRMTDMIREVDVTWHVSQQAAALVGQQIDPESVEPLQMVRYRTPDAHYQLHHDHGQFYGNTVSEQRPWTVLVFLNRPTRGGHTAFPRLGLEVVPRAGDALIWKNTLPDDDGSGGGGGTADPDMIHAGEPPMEGEKYALNVWFSGTKSLQGGRWGTQDGEL